MREQKRKRSSLYIFPLLLVCALLLWSCAPGSTEYHADSTVDYDKAAVIDCIGGDLDSDLSVFPDEVTAEKAAYEADFKANLFDTDGLMILDCTYDREHFEQEIERLSGLSKTIRYGDEEFTNEVLYDEETYPCPAYITIDGFGNTFEYALIDQAAGRIVYIYMAYPDDKVLRQYAEYVKKDLSAYEEENTLDAFSMYNHSFDGGESWVEFDDIVE